MQSGIDWILLTSKPLWQVPSAGLEVVLNPKGQTLFGNLGIWKPLWPLSKRNVNSVFDVNVPYICADESRRVQVELL